MTDFNSTVLKSADQIIVEESHRRGRIVVERFRWAVRPIYLRRFGRIQHLASCTLLRVGDVPLIITAAHVIDKHSHEVELLIGGRNEIVQLEGRFQSTTLPDDDRAKDHHDFSVARISDSLLPDLGEDSLILEDAVSLGRVVDKPRVYHCVGFTNSRNKDIRAREAKCKLWTFTSIASHENTSPRVGTTTVNTCFSHSTVVIPETPRRARSTIRSTRRGLAAVQSSLWEILIARRA
jgi:hypothetical protein